MVDGEITLLLTNNINNNSINWISNSHLEDENKTGN